MITALTGAYTLEDKFFLVNVITAGLDKCCFHYTQSSVTDEICKTCKSKHACIDLQSMQHFVEADAYKSISAKLDE